MSARLQEFIWLLEDRVNAEKAAEILTEMGTASEDDGQAFSKEQVLRIRENCAKDEKRKDYGVGCGRCEGEKTAEACAEELMDGLSQEKEALLTVWREQKNGAGKTERIAWSRSVRLEAMERILDEVFGD